MLLGKSRLKSGITPALSNSLSSFRTNNSWQRGETALAMAKTQGHYEVAAILESAMVSADDGPLPGSRNSHRTIER